MASRKPPDLPPRDGMEALAEKLAPHIKGPEKEFLNDFAAGKGSVRLSLGQFRRVLRGVRDSPDSKMPAGVRADVDRWLARHGAGREVGGPGGTSRNFYPPLDVQDLIERAAERAGMSFSAFVTEAAHKAALERLGIKE